MSPRYPDDDFEGRKVPPLVTIQDHTLAGTHQGSVHVEAGTFTLAGTLQGSLDLQPGTSALITGTQQGSVSVASGVRVTVTGAIQGSLNIDSGAEVIIESTGKLAGSLHNEGTVVVRGVFGGTRSGKGALRLEDQGSIKQPEIRDGVHHYTW